MNYFLGTCWIALRRCVSVLFACAMCLQDARAETEKTPFATTSYLAMCADHVPDVELSLVMDKECVSGAVRFCDLASDQEHTESCIVEVTRWMREDVSKNWPAVAPIAMELNLDKPPTATELENRVSRKMRDHVGTTLDCSGMKTQGVSAEVLCGYSDALAAWHTLRMLLRSTLELPEQRSEEQ